MNPQKLATAPTPKEDEHRKQQMQLAWKAYRGELPRPLKIKNGEPDDNVLTNRCSPIVDKGVAFLFGKTLDIEVKDLGDDAQDYINRAWGKSSISDDDDKMTLLAELALNGGVCGHLFLKVIPPNGSMKYPRLVALDPQLCRVVVSPDDCDLIIAYIIEYGIGDDMTKRQVYSRVDPDQLSYAIGENDLDDTWLIATYIKSATGQFLQQGQPDLWPYPFAPIFACQNQTNPNEFWGKPDLTPDIIQMNQTINFGNSNINRIGKIHGHPKPWTNGVAASQIKIGIDDIICLPSLESKLNILEAHGDIANLMAFVGSLRSDMDEQSRVPAVALGRLSDIPIGNLSGVAIQLLFQPLVEKTQMKQRLVGRLIRAITRALLVMGDYATLENYQEIEVDLHWQTLLPTDDLTAVQTAMAKEQLGVSKDTLITELGYDAPTETAKSADEASQAMQRFAKGQGVPPPAPQNNPQEKESTSQNGNAE